MIAQRTLRCSAAFAGLLLTAPAQAWNLDWALGLGYEHSDNLGRSTIDPRSGSRLSPFVDVSAEQDGEVLRALIAGSLTYNHYQGVSFDPNFSANLGAQLTWSISPERLLWTLDDYASQLPINVFASAGPDNVQNANVFSTGPTLLYRLSDTMAGRTELRYINSYAEETAAFNSDRALLTSRALRDLSPVSSISANVSAETVRLDQISASARDFNRTGAYAGYDWRSARTTVHADLGWNWVNVDGLDSRSGALARVSATVELTPISNLDVSVRRELSDARRLPRA